MICISFKRWRLTGLLVGLILAAGAVAAHAQLTDIPMWGSRRSATRSNIWDSFAPNGQSGSTWDTKRGRDRGQFSYPGGFGNFCCSATKDDRLLFGQKIGTGDDALQMHDHAAGKGILVATNAEGDKYLSWTGPHLPGLDTLPRIFDIENSRYGYTPGLGDQWEGGSAGNLSLGIDTKTPAHLGALGGVSNSNWYPGATSKMGGDATTEECYEIHNFDYQIYAPVQNASEEIFICEWQFKNDLVVTRTNQTWSHQDLDDGIVYEIQFENQGNKQLTDTYLGFMNDFYSSVRGCKWHNCNVGAIMQYRDSECFDDWFKFTESSNYTGDASNVGKFIQYAYDGNDVQKLDHEDTGDPFLNSLAHPCMYTYFSASKKVDGLLLSSSWPAIGILAFQNSGSSHTFNARDAAQGYEDPVGFTAPLSHYWRVVKRGVADEPIDGLGLSHEGRYDALTKPSDPDPTVEHVYFHDMMLGPWNLDPGDKAKIVMVMYFAGGFHTDIHSQTGYSKDIYQWAFDHAAEFNTNESLRIQEYMKGEQALGMMWDHYRFAYENDWQIPNTPPDVEMGFEFSAAAKNVVTWPSAESAINPDYGTADVTAYRVFQSDFNEYGPYRLKAEIPATGASTYSWEDPESLAGFGLYYNVRAVSSPKQSWSEGTKTLADLPARMASHVTGGMEGGWSALLEQRHMVQRFPKARSSTAFDNLEQPVKVVPNPFSLADASRNYQSTVNIRFVGVPRQATIKIYTVSGDLIEVIEHNNPDVGEVEWLQEDRFGSARAGTALYYFVVESSSGEQQIGSFVIQK